MKAIAFLLVSYILLSSALPCADSIECNRSNNTETLVTQAHSGHEHESEQCPPLCHCNCCSILITSHETVSYSIIETVQSIEKKYPQFSANNLTGYSCNVFQPPQLS